MSTAIKDSEVLKIQGFSLETQQLMLSRPKLKRPTQCYPQVECWWDDAAGLRHGWMDRTEKPKAQMVISVGFLIVDEGDHIIIAQDTDADGAHNGRTQIPRGMVKNLKLLRKKDAPKKPGATSESDNAKAKEVKQDPATLPV